MTTYRVEIRCDGAHDGCHVAFARGYPFRTAEEAAHYAASLDECAVASGWVRDGAAHFCPSCQCRRGAGVIIDAIGIHEVQP